MSLFGKKETQSKPSLPKLPELPKLPGYANPPMQDYNYTQEEPMIKEFPSIPEESTQEQPQEQTQEIHQLPTFPTSDVGEQFSQNSIKDAITGNEYQEEMPKMDYKELEINPKPIESDEPDKSTTSMNMSPKIEESPAIDFEAKKPKADEPIFIRIDKFEESLKIFNGVKGKLDEIQHMLNDVKEIKEKEQLELTAWEESIQKLKHQIEKVDRDIFSKIE